MQDVKRTAVIGAGPAGCAAAYELARTGRSVVLFEKEGAVGGRTASLRRDGHILDTGAGFFTNFYPRLSAYSRALGIADESTELLRQNLLVHNGRPAPIALGGVGSLLRFPFLSKRQILRMGWQTLLATLRYRNIDLVQPWAMARLDDRSIAEDARQRLGEEIYQFLIRPGIEPFWYFACEQVSRALYLTLQARAAGAAFYCFRDGMDTLCRRLSANLQVRTGVAVRAIKQGRDGLRLEGARDRSPFDEVVVATTADQALAITRRLPDSLVPGVQRAFLESQEYVPNVFASFRFKDERRTDLDTRIPVGSGEHPVAAIAFNSDKRPTVRGEDLLGVYLRAGASAELLGRSDRYVFRRALELARDVDSGLPEKLTPFHLVRRDRAIPVHAVGRYRLAAQFLRAQRGPVVFAGDYLSTATIDGALFTGQEAARVLCATGG